MHLPHAACIVMVASQAVIGVRGRRGLKRCGWRVEMMLSCNVCVPVLLLHPRRWLNASMVPMSMVLPPEGHPKARHLLSSRFYLAVLAFTLSIIYPSSPTHTIESLTVRPQLCTDVHSFSLLLVCSLSSRPLCP
jgi:hypothetical protein